MQERVNKSVMRFSGSLFISLITSKLADLINFVHFRRSSTMLTLGKLQAKTRDNSTKYRLIVFKLTKRREQDK